MYRKALIVASIFMLCLAAACSAQAAPTLGNTSNGTVLSQIADPSKLTVTQKLGVGILSLDESGFSITSEQAAVLLPLWQTVQSLGADKNAASQEIAALYTQIQGTLTPEQMAQIEQLTLSQEELASLLQQHVSLTSQGDTNVKAATSSSTSGQAQVMGGGPGGDMMPADAGLMMGGGAGLSMTTGQSTTTTTQQSLIASQASSNTTPDLNVLVAESVINLLQQRVDA